MGSVIAFQDATVADAAPVTSLSASQATTGGTDADSVVTQVTPARATAKRSSSGRTLGIAAGVLILALVGAVVYALTRQSATPAPATQQAPTQTSVPPASESPATEQTNTNQNTENQPSPLPDEAEPADAPKTTSAADKNTRRAQEPNKAKDTLTIPQPPQPPDGDVPQIDPNAPPDRRRRDRDNPYYDPEQTAEERRKAMQMRKRAIREQQRAERQRKRAEEMQRRESNRQP
jgi:hypothetical protein